LKGYSIHFSCVAYGFDSTVLFVSNVLTRSQFVTGHYLLESLMMASCSDSPLCIICCSSLNNSEFVTLTQKGLTNLKLYCSLRENEDLASRLSTHNNDITVHVVCRKKYTDKKRHANTQGPTDEGENIKTALIVGFHIRLQNASFFCSA
jgi:hypothetical protein